LSANCERPTTLRIGFQVERLAGCRRYCIWRGSALANDDERGMYFFPLSIIDGIDYRAA
jgi:hypothetical protein